MSRRKSTVHVGRPRDDSPALELERLEQATTLVLQEIDHNLSRANAIINDAVFPVLQKYAGASAHAWANAGFWKHFLEEAADVEINTLDQPLDHDDATIPALQKQLQTLQNPLPQNPLGPLDPDTPPVSDRGIETSTPQLRRTPSPSPHYVPRRGPRVEVSPRKRTPAARRLLVLQNFLNLLPTLPEPPVLLSERGRAAASSSSAAARPTSPDLGRLLPVALPLAGARDVPAAATPGARAQRFPLTPSFAAGIVPAPAPVPAAGFNDSADLVAPAPTARQDESDLLPFPRLQTLTGDPWLGGSPKRRRVDPSPVGDNVFLERAHSSTVYHSMVEAKPSRSMSDIFDEVLLEHIPGIQLEPEMAMLVETHTQTNTDPNPEKIAEAEDNHPNETVVPAGGGPNMPGEPNMSVAGATMHGDPAMEVSGADAGPSGAAAVVRAQQTGARAPEHHTDLGNMGSMAGLDPATHDADTFGFDAHPNLSLDSSANTSDLGSFLGERWKSLSRSLRKK